MILFSCFKLCAFVFVYLSHDSQDSKIKLLKNDNAYMRIEEQGHLNYICIRNLSSSEFKMNGFKLGNY